jgi:putative ABC transport system substrate-binding protein
VVDRRAFVNAAAGLLALPLAVPAQQAGRIFRLGILSPGARTTAGPGLPEWLVPHLHELGYVEGRNLMVEARYADDRSELLPGLARDLVQRNLDVIVTIGAAAIRAAMGATTAVPIVFLNNLDPVAAGFVASLARPGGNVTGVMITPQGTLGEKKLALLKEMVPRATRIVLLTTEPVGEGTEAQVEEVRRAAARLGLDIVVVEVRGGDYARAFADVAAARPAALFVGAHSRFVRDRSRIIALAAIGRFPAIYQWPQQVRDGGLMSYGASDVDTYRQVALYVDRIFKGARPGELPIEQPSKLLLVINLNTAKAMGLSIPQSLLLRADEVIR